MGRKGRREFESIPVLLKLNLLKLWHWC